MSYTLNIHLLEPDKVTGPQSLNMIASSKAKDTHIIIYRCSQSHHYHQLKVQCGP